MNTQEESKINPNDLWHYALRYRNNKDNPEFLFWFIDQLTKEELRHFITGVALNFNITEIEAEAKHIAKHPLIKTK